MIIGIPSVSFASLLHRGVEAVLGYKTREKLPGYTFNSPDTKKFKIASLLFARNMRDEGRKILAQIENEMYRYDCQLMYDGWCAIATKEREQGCNCR